jgi:hypothetical protein
VTSGAAVTAARATSFPVAADDEDDDDEADTTRFGSGWRGTWRAWFIIGLSNGHRLVVGSKK